MENNSSASRKSELEVLLKWLSDAATPGPWNPNPKRLEIPLSNGSTAYGPIMSYMVGCAESQDGMKVSLGSERTADHKFVAALVNAYRSGELVTRSETKQVCEPVPAGSDGWTDWQIPPMRGYRMQCCDCSLMHEVEFRVYRVEGRPAPNETYGPELPADEYRVQMRMRRT